MKLVIILAFGSLSLIRITLLFAICLGLMRPVFKGDVNSRNRQYQNSEQACVYNLCKARRKPKPDRNAWYQKRRCNQLFRTKPSDDGKCDNGKQVTDPYKGQDRPSDPS